MEIKLLRADISDAKELHAMQVESFRELLVKYQDYETNPANEDISKIESRLSQDGSYYYFICLGQQKVGAVRVIDYKQAGKSKWISPIFVLPQFCGKGIAQQAICLCEKKHGKTGWELATILQEEKNCYLYEKMGYVNTGRMKSINERLTLVYYEKT
ncbi:MAG: GNAT family N-acetyltransferase [Lachnospiraceae bacterium]|nr:GNAT family N-acetyltransferase [Lachnospiraceae bacterium]